MGGTGDLIGPCVGGTGGLIGPCVGGTGDLIGTCVGGTGDLIGTCVGGTGGLIGPCVGGTGDLMLYVVGQRRGASDRMVHKEVVLCFGGSVQDVLSSLGAPAKVFYKDVDKVHMAVCQSILF